MLSRGQTRHDRGDRPDRPDTISGDRPDTIRGRGQTRHKRLDLELVFRTSPVVLRHPSGQLGHPHEEAIDLAGCATAFVDRPDHQTLATAAITCGKDPFDIGRVVLMFRLYV